MLAVLISRDDLVAVLAATALVATVFGLAALFLWLRDRFRVARGVPEWKRRRSEMKALRAVTVYWILCLCASIAGMIFAATHGRSRFEQATLLVIALATLWRLRISWYAYRSINKKISSLTAEHQEGLKRPYEPLG
jgi:hypothetical protein